MLRCSPCWQESKDLSRGKTCGLALLADLSKQALPCLQTHFASASISCVLVTAHGEEE